MSNNNWKPGNDNLLNLKVKKFSKEKIHLLIWTTCEEHNIFYYSWKYGDVKICVTHVKKKETYKQSTNNGERARIK